MSNLSIQSLANMEYALYGGYGMNTAAPNYLNNYTQTLDNSIFNPAFGSYYNYNQTGFGQNIPNYYTQTPQQQTQAQGGEQAVGTMFNGLSQKDRQALADSYTKSLDPSESLLGAAAGGAAFGVILKPRLVAHPINSIASIGKVEEMFKGIKTEGSALNTLWKENNELMREAYGSMHKAVSRSKSKIGAFNKRYTQAEIESLEKLMKDALASGDKKLIAEATAAIDNAYVHNGWLPRGWNWTKRNVGKLLGHDDIKGVRTVEEAIHDTAKITEKSKALQALGGKSYIETLKTSGGGIKGGIFFVAIDYLMNFGKIKTAFKKDSKSGWTQFGQTTVKGIGNAAGWMAGEALGTWGAAKICAAIGTGIAPGVGTAIGAIAGIVVGSVGAWLAGKIAKGIVGQDIADKIETENLMKTQEGQTKIIQVAAEQVEKGKADPQTQQAVQHLISLYA